MRRESICKIFARIPEIETERLILRKISPLDVDDMNEYARNPHTTEFLTWSPHPDKAHTLEYINYLQMRYRTGDFYDWAVIWKESSKMIGTCGFTRFDFPNDSAEIGYVFNSEFHGRGIATEALKRVLEFGFDNLHMNRIEGRYMVENTASRRVMEKCGLTFEGVRREGMLIKGKYRNIGVCSILKSEYEAVCKKGNQVCKNGN